MTGAGATAGRGFTLAEMLLVCVLVCALAGAVAVPLEAVRSSEAERVTLARLTEIRVAMLGHVREHGRLPCPADPALPSGRPGAGQAATLASNECSGGYRGVVPWVSLGTAETDGWGRRFTYRVARDLADGIDECTLAPGRSICPAAAQPVSVPASAVALEVRVRNRVDRLGNRAAPTEPIALGLAAVIVSHGPNGFFGVTQAGSPVPAAATSGADERSNGGSAAVSFMTGRPRPARAQCDDERATEPPCEFDDRLAWITRGEAALAAAATGR